MYVCISPKVGSFFLVRTPYYSTFSEQSTQMHRKRTMVYYRIHRDLGVNTVKREIEKITTKYNTRIRDHVNTEASSLADPMGLDLKEGSHPT